MLEKFKDVSQVEFRDSKILKKTIIASRLKIDYTNKVEVYKSQISR